ncbi:SH3 domain-containing protein [Aquimarina sp. 2304DJ70-9]|uniref:SH3 domain-containing protein n=1 Tax=Aquimarina penaris TaxID=3231044 RepID=UPI0034633D2F
MKILQLTILFILIGLIPLSSQELGYINDSDGYTNLRLEPSGKSNIIGVILSGQEFKYYADDNSDWWKVDFKFRTGFMHKSRIKDFNKVKTEIGQFFQDFHSTNKNNAEYGEVNNEKLFLLTQKYPLATLKAFCEQPKGIQVFLISKYESPIHDGIDLQLIYSRLISINSTCSDTFKIKDALKIAAKNIGLTIIESDINFTKIPEYNKPKKKLWSVNKIFAGKINGKSIIYYLNHPEIDRFSKMYYQGQFKLSDNKETFKFLDSVMTQNDDTRPFYFYIFNNVLSVSDGALSEYVAETCLDYFKKNTCEFMAYDQNPEIKIHIDIWTDFIGWQLYTKSEFDKFIVLIDEKINKRCLDHISDWKNLKELIRSKLDE